VRCAGSPGVLVSRYQCASDDTFRSLLFARRLRAHFFPPLSRAFPSLCCWDMFSRHSVFSRHERSISIPSNRECLASGKLGAQSVKWHTPAFWCKHIATSVQKWIDHQVEVVIRCQEIADTGRLAGRRLIVLILALGHKGSDSSQDKGQGQGRTVQYLCLWLAHQMHQIPTFWKQKTPSPTGRTQNVDPEFGEKINNDNATAAAPDQCIL
jgi:hypothetical protein